MPTAKQVHSTRRQQEEQFAFEILDSLNLNIAVLDANGLIIAVNESWQRFARENSAPGSVSISDSVGKNYLNVCRRTILKNSDKYAPEACRGISAVLNGELDHFTLEYPCHSPDTQRWFIMSVTQLIHSASGVVIAHIPVTKRVIAQIAADKAEKNKANYLDIAAHELRNPICAVSLLVDLIQEKINTGLLPLPDLVIRLKEPTERLRLLVTDLLDVSRLERGISTLRVARSDFSEIVSKCVEEFRLRAPNRKIELKQSEKHLEALVDPCKINQVLSNLLDNALKYTPEQSSINVIVETLPRTIRVSVIDHGPGIPQERVANLLRPLEKGGSLDTAHSSGLGLGLSLCRGIIELHGGTIGSFSEVGHGSTFYFELPRSN